MTRPLDELINRIEKAKASIRAKAEHPFRVIKRQFGHVKTRYKGRMNNTQQMHLLFALSNSWVVCKQVLQGTQG